MMKPIFIIENITNSIGRGKLKIPPEHTVNSYFCFSLYRTIKKKSCYKSLNNTFMLISEFHFFNMKRKFILILANIVLKNLNKYYTPKPRNVIMEVQNFLQDFNFKININLFI